MPANYHIYSSKMVSKILLATSKEEVQGIVDATSNELKRNNANHQLFMKNLRTQLFNLSPLDFNSQQWYNIHEARVLCHRLSINNT